MAKSRKKMVGKNDENAADDSEQSKKSFENFKKHKTKSVDDSTSPDPYKILNVSKTATCSEIGKSYRRSALKYHPDKVKDQSKHEECKKQFENIVWAYAILSDEKRRRRFDDYGDTSEISLFFDDEENFDWQQYLSEMWQGIVSKETIEKFKKEYQDTEEETRDILEAYVEFEGDMGKVFETIMCSDEHSDDVRFKSIIESAIKRKEVPKFSRFSEESEKKKAQRKRKLQKEAKEAEKQARKLGINKIETESDLGTIIRKRAHDRLEAHIAVIEEKYVRNR